MREFEIRLRSVRDVQDFVGMATSRPYSVTIRDERNKINGKSFMEMFCLDFTRPMFAEAACTEAAFEPFRIALAKFAV